MTDKELRTIYDIVYAHECSFKAFAADMRELLSASKPAAPVYPQGVMGVPPYSPPGHGSMTVEPGLSWNSAAPAQSSVGVVAKDDVHGWHFAPSVGWETLGEGTQMFVAAPAQSDAAPIGYARQSQIESMRERGSALLYAVACPDEDWDVPVYLHAAAPAQSGEPVAWLFEGFKGSGARTQIGNLHFDGPNDAQLEIAKRYGWKWTPLYAAPQPHPNSAVAMDEREAKLVEALEETQGLLVAMLHETRPREEIEKQIGDNRTALQAVARATPEEWLHDVCGDVRLIATEPASPAAAMAERETFNDWWERRGPEAVNKKWTEDACWFAWQARAASQQATAIGLTRDAIQKKAIECGFEYWRASDAHGVTGTNAQAVDLLQDLLGVEVEINGEATATQPEQATQSEPFPYQKTFDAIAAATIVTGGHVAISVEAFKNAFGQVAQPEQAQRTLTDDVREVLWSIVRRLDRGYKPQVCASELRALLTAAQPASGERHDSAAIAASAEKGDKA